MSAAAAAAAAVTVATGLTLSTAHADQPATVGTQKDLDAYLKRNRNGKNTFHAFHYRNEKTGQDIIGASPAELCQGKKTGQKFSGHIGSYEVSGTCQFTPYEAPKKQYAGTFMRISSVLDNSCGEDSANLSMDRGMAHSLETSESKELSGGLMNEIQLTVGKSWNTAGGKTTSQGERSGFDIDPGMLGWLDMAAIKQAGVMRVAIHFNTRFQGHYIWYYHVAAAGPTLSLTNGMPDGMVMRKQVNTPCSEGGSALKPSDPFGGNLNSFGMGGPPGKNGPTPFGQISDGQKTPPQPGPPAKPKPVVTAAQCQQKHLFCLFPVKKPTPTTAALWSTADKSTPLIPLPLQAGLAAQTAANYTLKTVGLLNWDEKRYCVPPGHTPTPLPKGFPEYLDSVQVASGTTCPTLGK